MMILTSSVASVADHIYANYLADKDFKTILFIDTAAEPEIGHEPGDDSWLIADLESLQKQGYTVDRYSVTGKTRNEIEQMCGEYDVLYMCGGNTKHLIEQLHASDTFELIIDLVRSGKPYIGTSAGSIVTGPRLPDYYYEKGDADIRCLGLVNFSLVPHWGSPYFASEYKNGKRLDQVYNTEQEPLLVLTDSQYVVVNENGSLVIENK